MTVSNAVVRLPVYNLIHTEYKTIDRTSDDDDVDDDISLMTYSMTMTSTERDIMISLTGLGRRIRLKLADLRMSFNFEV